MNTNSLPKHAHLVSTPAVWMEGRAIEQFARVANEPHCVRAVGMPDLHPGRGIPIGAVFAFEGVLKPSLIGGDAGCGARLTVVAKVKVKGDALERRIRDWTDGPALPDCDPLKLLAAVWRGGPRALAEVDGVPDSLAQLAALEPSEAGVEGALPDDPVWGRMLGTAGGGNHFLELSRVTKTMHPDGARALGIRVGSFCVLAHSGSRGLGGALARKWGGTVLEQPEQQQRYLADLLGARRYARANRLVLSWRLLSALGAARASRITGNLDVVHNDVELRSIDGVPTWLHRKGAAPAARGEMTVVLGSRGAPSWVMRGLGQSSCLSSVAHGAGRKMGRSEAVEKLKHRYRRKTLQQNVICDDQQLLFAEHPDAYKPIGPVIDALVQAGAAEPVASLQPLFTIKR